MSDLLKYMADPDGLDELAQSRLRRMLKRYPWFGTARLLLVKATRRPDPLIGLRYVGRPLPAILLEKPNEAYFTGGQTLSLIDRFLSHPEERQTPEVAIVDTEDWSAESVAEDPDLISEELAQICLEQGLETKARAIYEKLSLLYPEKSVYFAEIINRIGSEPAEPSVNV